MDRKLKSEINRAKAIMKNEPDEWYYWYGYSLGLTDDHPETDAKMEPWKNSDSQNLQNIYKGYKNARSWLRIKGGPGRPKKVDKWLNRIGVPESVYRGLADTAASLGVSVPNIRRMAYARFLGALDEK